MLTNGLALNLSQGHSIATLIKNMKQMVSSYMPFDIDIFLSASIT